MERLPMCRVCLAGNVRMYEVVNINLRELYEKLTDNPFVTEDSRPMLACNFCCTKLKKCYQFQRQCLEAEERFAQMMNEDYIPNPSINQDSSEFCNGFSQSPIELISIVVCETENIVIKEELQDECERLDDTIEPEKEQQSDELDLENRENSFLDVEYIPVQESESDSEDDKTLMEVKIEVEELEASKTKRRASDTQHLEFVNNSYPVVEDTPALHAESDSVDVPLMEIKSEVDDEQESTGAPVAKKPKLDTRRSKSRDVISAEQKKNEYNRKLSSVSEIITKSQNHTSNRTTKFIKSFTKTHDEVCGRLNNTALSTSFRKNGNRDNIKSKISNKGIDSDTI